ncbi:Glucose-induced degradation protein 8-like [Porphyridium purpureum]|uniref:Glucose-induced degradation protein 8-like n=1 Tax=Porphyridium purpureum TaxID=35688 RepID=A0A5J4YHW3_PORPP|nr:Glucose-induced degradation protein 8-like [Porphyridium purpureum]|eukprot:POR9612..scf297_16
MERIAEEEWEARLNGVKIDRSELNKVVMNYLFIEGYQEAAIKFAEESRLETPLDLRALADRTECRVAIQNGDVQLAIEKANEIDPLILDHNSQLFFHLQQQKLIELIRQNKIDAAIDFAQNELAPRGEENPQFLPELERVMALLAFENPRDSPLASFLDAAQRHQTASELNAAILASQCQSHAPSLPGLLAMLGWSQAQLSERCSFPHLNLSTGELLPDSEMERDDSQILSANNM